MSPTHPRPPWRQGICLHQGRGRVRVVVVAQDSGVSPASPVSSSTVLRPSTPRGNRPSRAVRIGAWGSSTGPGHSSPATTPHQDWFSGRSASRSRTHTDGGGTEGGPPCSLVLTGVTPRVVGDGGGEGSTRGVLVLGESNRDTHQDRSVDPPRHPSLPWSGRLLSRSTHTGVGTRVGVGGSCPTGRPRVETGTGQGGGRGWGSGSLRVATTLALGAHSTPGPPRLVCPRRVRSTRPAEEVEARRRRRGGRRGGPFVLRDRASSPTGRLPLSPPGRTVPPKDPDGVGPKDHRTGWDRMDGSCFRDPTPPPPFDRTGPWTEDG